MGRPLKDIDPEQVKKLAAIQCTMIEMAHVLSCSVDTLENRFSDIIKEGRSQGTMSLKRKQYEVAISGNVSMLIWLGKQHLGQVEKQTVEISDEAGKEFEDQSSETILRFIKGARP